MMPHVEPKSALEFDDIRSQAMANCKGFIEGSIPKEAFLARLHEFNSRLRSLEGVILFDNFLDYFNYVRGEYPEEYNSMAERHPGWTEKEKLQLAYFYVFHEKRHGEVAVALGYMVQYGILPVQFVMENYPTPRRTSVDKTYVTFTIAEGADIGQLDETTLKVHLIRMILAVGEYSFTAEERDIIEIAKREGILPNGEK